MAGSFRFGLKSGRAIAPAPTGAKQDIKISLYGSAREECRATATSSAFLSSVHYSRLLGAPRRRRRDGRWDAAPVSTEKHHEGSGKGGDNPGDNFGIRSVYHLTYCRRSAFRLPHAGNRDGLFQPGVETALETSLRIQSKRSQALDCTPSMNKRRLRTGGSRDPFSIRGKAAPLPIAPYTERKAARYPFAAASIARRCPARL